MLNEELGKRTAELEATNKELEAFALIPVSHDLRAPLRHMAGFTELLRKNTASLLIKREKPTSLEQLAEEALTETRKDTEGRNIVWRVGGLPPCYGDRSMLRLVLLNLISNAFKFTSTRSQAEIEIGCLSQRTTSGRAVHSRQWSRL